jgi:RNA polymerase sigma factor (sigma-70 family)
LSPAWAIQEDISFRIFPNLSQLENVYVIVCERRLLLTEILDPNKAPSEDGAAEHSGVTVQTLVKNYASTVLAICLTYTRNLHDSEDIMQDVFLKAVQKIDTLREPQRAGAWLKQIARRRCIDHQRKRARRESFPVEPVHSARLADDVDIRALHQALLKLPENYREPIALYYLNGHSCRSVAGILGISEQAVRRRLVRARVQLHTLLSEDIL